MVGSKSSGNPYSFFVNPESELGQFINFLTSKTGLGKGTWVMGLILKTFEKEAKQYFKETFDNENLYDELLEKYSLNVHQQKAKRRKEKEEYLSKLEEKLKLEREKLELAKKREERLQNTIKPEDEEIQEEPSKLDVDRAKESEHWRKWVKERGIDVTKLSSEEYQNLRKEWRELNELSEQN